MQTAIKNLLPKVTETEKLDLGILWEAVVKNTTDARTTGKSSARKELNIAKTELQVLIDQLSSKYIAPHQEQEQKLQRLIYAAPAASAIQLQDLRRQQLAAQEAFKLKASRGNTDTLKKIGADLAGLVDSLWAKHFPKESASPQQFNQREAVEYLTIKGYSCSEATFSNHIRDGLITRQQNKKILLPDLENYAARHLDGGDSGGTDEQSRIEKGLDISLKRKKLERAEMENRKEDRNWIPREKVYEREGALAGQIMGEMRYQINQVAPRIIAICKGDPQREADVFKALENTVFAAFRNLYDTGEVDITFDEDED